MKRVISIILLFIFVSSLCFSGTSTGDIKKFIGKKVIIQYANYDKEVVGTLDNINFLI